MTYGHVFLAGTGLAITAGLLLALGTGAGAADRGPGAATPTVVELFTSQGCSSCPPADALLDELDGREDVIALAFHIDYWDHLGWHDPFAAAWATRRQQGYRDALGLPYVYTPQMVVDGQVDVVGSDRDGVLARIGQSRRLAGQRVAVALARREGGRLGVRVAAAVAAGPARVLLLAIDPRHQTAVRGGENGGRVLTESQVVRAIAEIGRWDGAALELEVMPPLPAPERQYVALLQRIDAAGRLGPVLGAARLSPD